MSTQALGIVSGIAEAVSEVKSKLGVSESKNSEMQFKTLFLDFYANSVSSKIEEINAYLSKNLEEGCFEIVCLENFVTSKNNINNYQKLFLQFFLKQDNMPVNPLCDSNFLIEANLRDTSVLMEISNRNGSRIAQKQLNNVLDQDTLERNFVEMLPEFINYALKESLLHEPA